MSRLNIPLSAQVGTLAAASAASLFVGYYLGKLYGTTAGKGKEKASEEPKEAPAVTEEPDSEEEEESLADGDLSAIKAGFLEPCKMVLVVRNDLGMTSGKIAAQCGHATLACYKALVRKNPALVSHWERTGQAKIALKASSEDQLIELEAIARSLNLCARSIHDAGHTQVDAGTRTVLGIGPAPVSLVNQVTGKLRLL
ncbi:hypothetical protein D9756_004242 [Leucocoprinus leucothites]|uniref:peptidyl-tRNA hydrolase n=1 Tax=Leucocoprinus leucothites TaxID=201217 RepID=A0A8H5D9W6_9AGAR|nr:hypothetical protein D9756_004242 [Leucoagaricus leucothites]